MAAPPDRHKSRSAHQARAAMRPIGIETRSFACIGAPARRLGVSGAVIARCRSARGSCGAGKNSRHGEPRMDSAARRARDAAAGAPSATLPVVPRHASLIALGAVQRSRSLTPADRAEPRLRLDDGRARRPSSIAQPCSSSTCRSPRPELRSGPGALRAQGAISRKARSRPRRPRPEACRRAGSRRRGAVAASTRMRPSSSASRRRRLAAVVLDQCGRGRLRRGRMATLSISPS